MIDTNFIIRYTNGLYSTDKEYCPRYDEFRDMFSSGQLQSKEWAVNTLERIGILNNQSVVIVGAWYGTLGLMLNKHFNNLTIKLLDIDPRCQQFLEKIIYDIENISAVTEDMHNYNYTEDIVINTSCEHIEDVKKWLDLVPDGTIVVLQSNNFFHGDGHISSVSCQEEFEIQTNLSSIMFSGSLETPMYTRYMIIGIK